MWAFQKIEAKFTHKHTQRVHRHTDDYLSSFAVLSTKNNETLKMFSLLNNTKNSADSFKSRDALFWNILDFGNSKSDTLDIW